MSGDRVRLLLATKFPERYIRDTIEPGLRDIGADIGKIVSTEWEGSLVGFDGVAFMFQMCSHANYDAFKSRAKAAGVPFVHLSRRMPEWVAAFRHAGVKLPVARSGERPSFTSSPPRPSVAPRPPMPRTFGAALRAARNEEDVTQAFIAELCGVSPSLVGAWEADRQALAPDCYDKLCELFPELSIVDAPEITRKASHRGPLGSPEASPIPRPDPLPPPPVPVLAPPKPTNGHAVASPLAGLLRAARALGLDGDVIVTIGDNGTAVRIGGECWSGETDADAVAQARKALGDRLSAQLARLTEARQLLGVAS